MHVNNQLIKIGVYLDFWIYVLRLLCAWLVQALCALSVPVAAPSREPLRLHAVVLGAVWGGAVSVWWVSGCVLSVMKQTRVSGQRHNLHEHIVLTVNYH